MPIISSVQVTTWTHGALWVGAGQALHRRARCAGIKSAKLLSTFGQLTAHSFEALHSVSLLLLQLADKLSLANQLLTALDQSKCCVLFHRSVLLQLLFEGCCLSAALLVTVG
jgi:hypothetical protein